MGNGIFPGTKCASKGRSVTGPDAHYCHVCGEKLPRAKQKQETEKEKKQYEQNYK